MSAAATLPQLPEPILARWQPLRMGIVDETLTVRPP